MKKPDGKKSPILTIALVVLFLVAPLLTAVGDPRVIRIGAFNYFPGIFQDKDGSVKGFYVDALK